ncbi:hypothetical protein Sango_2798200 [Sesamum angolense]|uniref:Reverse transcriptase Ty1/copia-type domain-containing protein n=1 Tax=Sesamum angolense TaxID=2727404 RepID=A0AAE1T8L5_9LAMI|nr:hypothetical protein Sango_2977100 [Sesamum angolense]KAK4383207.1 hypothetical protein Sango_2798200 [Sesamum angolense]
MRHEIQALEINCLWKHTQLHVCKKPISWKWVFKTTLKANGSVERYKLTHKLEAYGFVQSAHDHCFFTMHVDLRQQFLGVCRSCTHHGVFYVSNTSKKYLRTFLAQTKYTLDVIKDTRLHNSKAVSTLFPQGLKLSTDCRAQLQQPDAYRWLEGHLLYLEFSWPSISHFVQQLS